MVIKAGQNCLVIKKTTTTTSHRLAERLIQIFDLIEIF